MRNKEKDAVQMAERRQKILETGFRLFTEKNIDRVSMPDIAKECGCGIATLYRYFNTKDALVIAIGTLKWQQFFEEIIRRESASAGNYRTAAQRYEVFLDSFIELYREQRNLLRFNQFFNVYLESGSGEAVSIEPYFGLIERIANYFSETPGIAKNDGTLSAELSPQKLFTVSLHLMLAAATRFAVGLIYTPEGITTPEEELLLLKDMLLSRFTA